LPLLTALGRLSLKESNFKAHLAGLLINSELWYFFGDIAPIFDVAQAIGLKMDSDIAACLIRCLAIFKGQAYCPRSRACMASLQGI
jgi:hypothetical protein